MYGYVFIDPKLHGRWNPASKKTAQLILYFFFFQPQK